MKAALWLSGLLLLCPGSFVAQDKPTDRPPDKPPADRITLNNGDTLTGTIKSMADGEITVKTSLVGEVKIKLADVKDLVTGAPVVLQTKEGERLSRRVTGMQNGQLQLAEDASGAPGRPLPIASLEKINPPPAKWDGNITFGGWIQTGNTDRRSANGDLSLVRRSEGDRLNFLGWWEYAETKDALTKDWTLDQRRTGGQVKYDYFLGKKSYVWANTTAEGDYKANLDLRYTIGAGYGYQFIENDTTKFGAELGLSHLSEDYRDATPTKEYLAARVAYKLEHKVTDTLTFWQVMEAYPSVEDIEDFVGRLDSRLIARLTESMIAQAKVVLDYNTSPAAGKESLDVGYYLSVGWTF
jgi:putative salt-induced outer membrane protein YdiY